jgi:Flp pilus assembly protein TadB
MVRGTVSELLEAAEPLMEYLQEVHDREAAAKEHVADVRLEIARIDAEVDRAEISAETQRDQQQTERNRDNQKTVRWLGISIGAVVVVIVIAAMLTGNGGVAEKVVEHFFELGALVAVFLMGARRGKGASAPPAEPPSR